MYYNKKGEEITMEEWAKLFEDEKYREIKQTEIDINKCIVSTIWAGLCSEENKENGALLIFQTIVIKGTVELKNVESERYSTIKEAKEGHKAMVKKWSSKLIV